MVRITPWIAVIAVAVACAPLMAATDKNKTEDAVVKIVETPKKDATVLHVAAPVGTGTEDIVLSKPDPETVDLLLNCHPGDLMEVKTNIVNGKPVLVSASAYTIKPGEDQPNVFIFSKKTTYRLAGTDALAIEVTKFLKPTVLVVPVIKGKDGKPAPNADMAKTVEALTANDPVEVQATPLKNAALLKSLKVYVPFKRAQFVQLDKKEIEGKKFSAIKVLDDGKPVLLAMHDQDVTALTAKAHDIKHGDDMLYRAKEVDDVVWITDIKPVPKAAPTDSSGSGGTRAINGVPRRDPPPRRGGGRPRH